MSNEEAIYKSNCLIRQATIEHLVSDVPVGLFLSGGYDSTTLLMQLSELHYSTTGFTIAFPDSEKNESSQAAAAAKAFGASHEIEEIGKDTDIFALLEQMSPIYDEPFAGDSMINAWLVSRLAARHSKVAISGEGADEVFGGYKWHRKIESYYQNYNLKQRVKNLMQGIWTPQQGFLNLYNRSMPGVFAESISEKLLNSEIRERIRLRGLWHFKEQDLKLNDPVKRCQFLDTHTFIPNHCLFRADLSSMAHSLEVRVPFLDHQLYEFVFSLQRKVYMKPGIKKFLLEENLKHKVPNVILNMPKRGFSFQNPENIFDDRFEALLQNGELVKRGIIKRSFHSNNISNHLKFHLLNLELWMRNHG
jgi:asparagine synthase (glutamine-hydrolysing)